MRHINAIISKILIKSKAKQKNFFDVGASRSLYHVEWVKLIY